MPYIEPAGIKVESPATPETEKNSSAPLRTCDSISVSPPSWLLGNTLRANRPSLSFRILSAASSARAESGCVAGTLVPYLYSNAGAAALACRMLNVGTVAAAAAAPMKPRRVRLVFMGVTPPSNLLGLIFRTSDLSANHHKTRSRTTSSHNIRHYDV